MLSTANLSLQFSAKPLFENISVKFDSHARYGLIGANGCGKSSLLKILSGENKPSSGQVILSGGERIGPLGQDQFAFEEFTALEAVMMGYEEFWAIHQERDLIYKKAEMTEEDGMKIADLETQYAEMDGYTAQSRACELLSHIGLSDDAHHTIMKDLAPALKLRILLAQVLFANPDIMLLDEPTNNLDIETIRWLEQILTNKTNTTMIIISHDRHFLNSVCTHTADLDYGGLQMYPGNYDQYMTASTQARETAMNSNARKQEKIKDLKAFVSRFSANASKAKQATSRARLIDKIELEEIKPSSRKSPFVRFVQKKVLHKLVLTLEDLKVGHNNQSLLTNLSCTLKAGEKIAIIGPSGLGKTTLLDTLVRKIKPVGGTLHWAEHAQIGYLPQDHHGVFDEKEPLFDWMSQWGLATDDEQSIRAVLGRLLFSGERIHKPISVLSGGERVRMLLGKMMLQQPNVLVLDEPTNHLDMESIESVQLALEDYPGTLFFVSHDQTLVSAIATQIIAIQADGSVEHYTGSFDDYMSSLAT